MSIYQKLINVQQELKAPKSQYNKFGKYYYRSTEDILNAVKPLLQKNGLALTISDEIVLIGDRYYVKAEVILTNGDETIKTQAYAREEEEKKGMDSSQITGSSSSYARKYALNGMFAINDVEDSDKTNTGETKANLATKEQLSKLYELAKKYNHEEEIAKYIQTNFNKKTSKELTVEEADQLLKVVEAMKS